MNVFAAAGAPAVTPNVFGAPPQQRTVVVRSKDDAVVEYRMNRFPENDPRPFATQVRRHRAPRS